MASMGTTPRSDCPVSLALEVIGDRWSLLILRDLFRGKCRYQELLNSKERIATNILAERLVRLEQQGLITKADGSDDRRPLGYAPTKKGRDLLPVIYEMARWSAKYDPRVDRSVLQRMRDTKERVTRRGESDTPKERVPRDAGRRGRNGA